MPRSLASQLAEAFDLFHGHSELVEDMTALINFPYFGQVKHGVKQHGSVAIGEDEAVAIEPGGVGGIVAKEILPKGVGCGCQTHRRAGMTRVGLLDRIDGK